MKIKIKNSRQGFSLIELLVVIFIIGVLAGVVFPNFMGARERARDARRKQDLESVRNALRIYYNDNQAYPTPGVGGALNLSTSYIGQMPSDPLGTSYAYSSTSPYDRFMLSARLENGSDQDIAASQTRCGYPVPTPSIFMICGN